MLRPTDRKPDEGECGYALAEHDGGAGDMKRQDFVASIALALLGGNSLIALGGEECTDGVTPAAAASSSPGVAASRQETSARGTPADARPASHVLVYLRLHTIAAAETSLARIGWQSSEIARVIVSASEIPAR